MPNTNRSSHEDALCNSVRRFNCRKCLKPVCFCAGNNDPRSGDRHSDVCNFCQMFDEGAFQPMSYEEAEAFNWSAEWWAVREQGESAKLMRDDFK